MNTNKQFKEQIDLIVGAGEKILRSIWIHPDLFHYVNQKVKPENFPMKWQQVIYETYIRLFEKSEAIDNITVTLDINERGLKFQEYIDIIDSLANPNRPYSMQQGQIDAMLDVMQGHWVRKQLKTVSTDIMTKLKNPSKSPFDLLNEIRLHCDSISENVEIKKTGSLQDVSEQLEQRIAHAKDNSGKTGVDLFGIYKLDYNLSGGEPGDLIVIGGRTGMGKSSLQNSAAVNFVNMGECACFWSLEMPNVETYGRIVSAMTGISYQLIKRGQVDSTQQQQIYEAYDKINNSKIVLEDRAGVTALDIKTKIATLKATHDIKAIFVDRLGLLNHLPSAKGMMKVDAIGETTKLLRQAAMEYKIPIVIHSQLSRVKDRDYEPRLSHLRSSGHIEQDAKKILLIYRPEYYAIEDYEGLDARGLGIVEIAKNSNGPLESIKTQFVPESMYFKDHPSDLSEIPDIDRTNNAVTNNRPVDTEEIPF